MRVIVEMKLEVASNRGMSILVKYAEVVDGMITDNVTDWTPLDNYVVGFSSDTSK